MEDREEQVDPSLGDVHDAHGQTNRFLSYDTGDAAKGWRDKRATADAIPFLPQVSNPSSPAMSPDNQTSYGLRLDTSQGFPSPFNLGPMAGALSGQVPKMAPNRRIPTSSHQSQRTYIGVSATRSPDPGYIAPQQQGYYQEYGTNESMQASPAYMSPQYMQYQGQLMHNQPTPGFVPMHHPQRYSFSSQPQAYPPPGHTFYTQGHGQQFMYNSSGVATHSRPAQLGYPVGLNGTHTRSTRNELVGTASSRPDISVHTIPRGPPRKPRQSGHALWVGNLPPGATVIDLKDHFSREATNDIESLKLISKSNCAFVNYRSHVACAAAMERFHDSRFHGTKLVCRLRRTTPGSPLSPSQLDVTPAQDSAEDKLREEGAGVNVARPTATNAMDRPPPAADALPERFFVLKSLTLQDLEASTRSGVWATQAHNEESLNRAYEAAENVYLFFSANKSGEYFGCARMVSRIGAPGVSFEQGDRNSGANNTKTTAIAQEIPPKAIPTPGTEWAPPGRIIDDTARGTIFWEADLGDGDKGEALDETEATLTFSPSSPLGALQEPAIASSTPVSLPASRRGSTLETIEAEEAFPASPGKAFRVEWLSVKKLPFYKCRGLRNPWNANREVKIARDGTELETNVGKNLMMFFGSPGYVVR